MQKLFIEKNIEINAAPEKVWQVLTERKYSDLWTNEFMHGMYVQSDWKPGSAVLWNDVQGNTVVEGNVVKIEPPKLLYFTVFDVEMGRMPVNEDDGMTFELKDKDGKTELHLRHGDFAIMPEGEKYYKMTLEIWDQIFPKIKELAERK